ncbi:hypothetical protein HYU50_02980 [Candidatus Woesearchaeota archaeon]|nr:hypothetical protein [Candidatus Woesearchaeota archaeon]
MKTSYKGPFILGLSVGIGDSIKEAQEALKNAKSLKETVEEGKPIKIRFNGPYSIAQYSGSPLLDEAMALKELETDLGILNSHSGNPRVYADMLTLIEGKRYDHSTGTLTPYGYQFQLEQSVERERSEYGRTQQRRLLFFDCNDMHHWNDLTDYDEVTRHIAAIGRALSHNSRNERQETRDRDLVTRVMQNDSLVQRIHGSAGDEFLVNVRAPKDKLVLIAEKLIKSAYKTQMDMYSTKGKK